MQHIANSKVILSTALLIFVAIAAGCVGQMPGLNTFGSDVVTPARTVTTTGVTEPLLIENVRTLPDVTVMPGQDVRLLMNLVSHEVDPEKEISAYINLFDAHVFTSDGKTLCNSINGGCPPSKCTSNDQCPLHPSEIQPIEFNLKAPSATAIANIITRATLSWLVRYNYETSTNYDILVVSMDEIKRLQQEGQTLTVPVQDTKGAGPIKIEITGQPAFAISGDTTGQSQTIYVTVKLQNVGSGFPVLTEGTSTRQKIAPRELKIQFPPGLTVTSAGNFEETTIDGKVYHVNEEAIEFFKKETTPLLFILKSTENLVDVPHRTYTINAFLDYTYELRGSTTLEITPPQFS